jgi:hypothetical protein
MFLVFGFDWGFMPWHHDIFNVFRNPSGGYIYVGDESFLAINFDQEECENIVSELSESEKHHFNFEACLNNQFILKGYSRDLFTMTNIETAINNFAFLANMQVDDKKAISYGYNPNDLSQLPQTAEPSISYFDLYDNAPSQERIKY